jgi:hypothetical protein
LKEFEEKKQSVLEKIGSEMTTVTKQLLEHMQEATRFFNASFSNLLSVAQRIESRPFKLEDLDLILKSNENLKSSVLSLVNALNGLHIFPPTLQTSPVGASSMPQPVIPIRTEAIPMPKPMSIPKPLHQRLLLFGLHNEGIFQI